MNEKDLLEEIGKVSEELIAAHALPDAKRFGEGSADKSVTAKEHIVMKQKKNEYIRNPFIRALPGIAAAAAVIVAGVIILPKTNLIRMPGTSVGSEADNGYRMEFESAELRMVKGENDYGSLHIKAKLVYPELDAPTTVWYGEFSIKNGDVELYGCSPMEEPTGETTAEGEMRMRASFDCLSSGDIPVDAENAPLPISFVADNISAEMLENAADNLVLSAEFNIGAADPVKADQIIRLEMPFTYQIGEVTGVAIQDMTGWNFEVAKDTLLDLNLYVDKRTCFDAEVPEGCVVATEPEGPATVEVGSYVQVYVSLGARPGATDGATIVVPDFKGMNWEQACEAADKLNILLKKKEVASEEPAGYILSQEMEPGCEVPEGAVITVEVSGTADSAALTEVEIPIAVPANANGKFYFTVYSLFDLGEDPAPFTTTKVFEAGEGLPEIGTAKVTFFSENNVDAGVMLYNAETGEKAQIATFNYIHGSGFQELPGQTNPELLNSDEAFRRAGLLK